MASFIRHAPPVLREGKASKGSDGFTIGKRGVGGEGYRVGAEGKISLAGQRRTRVSVTEKKA